MTNPAKAKGDRAELEAAEILSDLLGVPVRRRLCAGRKDDVGYTLVAPAKPGWRF
jgi:hypothetical protein